MAIKCNLCNWEGQSLWAAKREDLGLDDNGIRYYNFNCPICNAASYHLKEVA